MQTARRTTIDDLATLGQELPERHLTLAAGGRRPLGTYVLDPSYMNGQMVDIQLIPD